MWYYGTFLENVVLCVLNLKSLKFGNFEKVT